MGRLRTAAIAPLLLVGFVAVAVPVGVAGAAGTISLTALGTPYTQNFDTLSNTAGSTTNDLTLNGWYMTESGGGARDNEQYAVDTGGSTTGDTYSYGAAGSTERALGALRSGTLIPTYGATFTNNTGATITSFTVAYTGEEWRLGTAGRTDQISFEYSTNATDLTTGTWTNAALLNFVTPDTVTTGAKNGNAAGERTALSGTITNLSIPQGASFWIRWTDVDASGADDGLAVDDFSLTPNGTTAPTLSVNDVSQNEGNSGTTAFTFTVALSSPAPAGGVTFDVATADGTAIAGSDYTAKSLTGQVIAEGASTYTFTVLVNGDTDVESNETFFVNVTNVTGATVADGQGQGTIVNDDVTITPIHTIQGASHRSPLEGQRVTTTGVVTAKAANGFYLQDPAPDADDATSEGLFVFTSTAPAAAVGNAVQVTGTVTEFRSGGASSTNLTTTELVSPAIVTLSTGNPLPAPVVLGAGGRVPPTTVIEDDASGSVETSGIFDPASDGIDFYESLEGMRVQVNDAVAVGPRSDFGSNRELPVVGDAGAGASLRTSRGGLVVQPTDFNPERIILNDMAGNPQIPPANVNDSLPGATVGVIDYSFGNFKLKVTGLPAVVSGNLAREVATAAGPGELSIASFNVENLAPSDPAAKFANLASLVVTNLQAPDLVAIEEIQDDNGIVDDGTVDASLTWTKLIDAITAAGGPAYQYRQIDPVNDQDGGAPGGNIRQGFLFRIDRGLGFVDIPGGTSTSAVGVQGSGAATTLSASPGRIDPLNPAFTSSRKPLVGQFTYLGQSLFVVANHFNSKSGDDPLFGRSQPPTRNSEVQRHQQAQVVNTFVNSLLGADAAAKVVVLGDLNDFQFSDTLHILEGGVLHTLMDTLPASERYSYVFDGNAQAIDHVLLSDSLFAAPFTYDSVHVNAEFADQASDHDPQLVRLRLNAPPTVDAGGPYSVDEGGNVTLTATGSDPNGDSITYAWDLDNNGSFETPGQSVTFSAASLDGPGSVTVKVRATDAGGLTADATTTVTITNVAPTVATPTITPSPSVEGQAATASASFTDPAPNDAPFTCTVDYGDGSGALPGSVSGLTCTGPAHVYATYGTYTVTVSVTDKDGATGSRTATQTVVFAWTGFFAPVDNLPTPNILKAGQAVPVKFALGGDRGLGIFAAGYPKVSSPLPCSATAGDEIEQTMTAGSSGLQYDPVTQTYTYVWKTDRAWAGSCRALTVKLVDGSTHTALFRFTR